MPIKPSPRRRPLPRSLAVSRDPESQVRILMTPQGGKPAIRNEVHLVDAQAVAQLGSWELDLATGVTAMSAEMRRIFGWTAEGEPELAWICDMVHPDDRRRVEDWLARNAAMRPPARGCFFRAVRPDGTLRMFYGRSALRTARNGALARICGTVQDVTEQTANERAVGEAAHLYRDIFENCAWGIFQTTPDGRYLTANPALARIYGYDGPEQLLSRLTDIGGQLYADPARRDEFVRIMRENGVVLDFESEVHRRDGATIWITETCREVRTSTGRLLYYEGTVEDITERKRREEELRAAKEAAETANRAKTEFLATMSHELRTPLNAVMGFAEIIHKEAMGAVNIPAYRDYAGNIHASGQHLLAVINDILDFVKAESGNLPLEIETVDLAGLTGGVIRLLENQAKSAGVCLIEKTPAGAVPCPGDERRLRQVLINLAGNAVKFTPSGGSVTLSCTEAEGGRVRLEVRDTGIGMSAGDLAHVGEPFYQADSKLDRQYEGTGLGLAICQRLVKLHGGSMEIDSALGQGTTVAILLPGGSPQLPVL